MINDNYFFEDYPLVNHLNIEELANYLEEIGDTDDALTLRKVITDLKEKSIDLEEKSFTSFFDSISDRFNKIYLSNNYTIGYYPQLDNEEYIEIKNASIIEPASSLKKINIKLNRLFIKEYPGGKSHTILFNFYTENKIDKIDRKEKVHFNQTYQIQNEGSAPIDGVQIFNNLNLDETGLIFRFTSINVKDEKDKSFLKTLNSNTIKMGLVILQERNKIEITEFNTIIITGDGKDLVELAKTHYKDTYNEIQDYISEID